MQSINVTYCYRRSNVCVSVCWKEVSPKNTAELIEVLCGNLDPQRKRQLWGSAPSPL